MSIEIKKVSSKKELKEFVRFPLRLYKNNPYYIPALTFDELNTLNPKKNPAFEFCDADCFLAIRDKKTVGRIAVILNKDVNKWWKQDHARFGWFDVIDDPEVTSALLEVAEQWAKDKGMKALKGPLGFCDLDHEGMLVNGFDKLGTFVTIYNYPYYPIHLEHLGYRKDVDWKEYQIIMPSEVPERYTRMAAIVSEKYGLRLAEYKSKRDLVKRYGKKLFQLWNDSYNVLYGYSPLTSKQVDYFIKVYLSVIRIDLICLIIDKDDNVIGMGIALPSMSKALQKANGRLFPFGIFHIINAIRKNDTVDLYLMGIHPDYQGKGINSLILTDLVPKFIKNGYKLAETNPELELNGKIQVLWSEFGPIHHKRRRIYIKEF